MWDFSQYGSQIALINDLGERVSYGELQQDCEKIKSVIEKRSLVFCLCENKVGSVAGYAAFLNHQIVPVLLNAHLEGGLLANLLETYKPEFLWLPKEQIEKFPSMAKVLDIRDYSLLKTDFGEGHTLYPDLALLLTTSGSTGSPKFVRQSYANIKANTESIIEYLNMDSSERAITTLPMKYT